MHFTARANAKRFFDTYLKLLACPTVVDIGSQNLNGSLKEVCSEQAKYIGVDFVAGKGVDVVLNDPYRLPFETSSIDVVVSSSVFEHSEMFWVLFLEILRVLKPEGLFFLNVPSNGAVHRYPVDCWRFYPDSGKALVAWAERNSYQPALIESYISKQRWAEWNDCVSVFIKDKAFLGNYPMRILHHFDDYTNGFVVGEEGYKKFRERPQDQIITGWPLIKTVWRSWVKLRKWLKI